MVPIDSSITLALIVTLCAIVSPILTAIVNNHHQMKMKKMDIDQKKYDDTVLYKRTIFENYLKAAGECFHWPDDSTLKKYGDTYFVALMYATGDLKDEMITVDTYIRKSDIRNAANDLEFTAKLINDFLNR